MDRTDVGFGEAQDDCRKQALRQLLAGEVANLERLCGIAGRAGLKIVFCDEEGVSVAQYSTPPVSDCAKGGLTPRMLRRVREYIRQHLADTIRLEELASITGLSRCYFAHAFKRSIGLSPYCFLMQCRIEHAQKLLAETHMSLAQIALASGFSDQSHLSRRFRQSTGQTPRSFRQSQS